MGKIYIIRAKIPSDNDTFLEENKDIMENADLEKKLEIVGRKGTIESISHLKDDLFIVTMKR